MNEAQRVLLPRQRIAPRISQGFRDPQSGIARRPFVSSGLGRGKRLSRRNGSWVNPGSHTVFLLMDAANAHVVDEVVRESGLIGRTSTQVFAVDGTQAVLAEAGQDG